MTTTTTPRIHVRRTKTAGYQLIYIGKTGHETVLQRRLAFSQAVEYGNAAARIHDNIPLQVDAP